MNIDFVFCVLSQEPYTEQFFLFSAADEDSIRGMEYENAYLLGNIVKLPSYYEGYKVGIETALKEYEETKISKK